MPVVTDHVTTTHVTTDHVVTDHVGSEPQDRITEINWSTATSVLSACETFMGEESRAIKLNKTAEEIKKRFFFITGQRANKK